MLDKVITGLGGEKRASRYLQDIGFEILDSAGGQQSSFDIAASKNNVKYLINVKTVSKEGGIFGIQLSNVGRLIKQCVKEGAVATYLLVYEGNFAFFTFAPDDSSNWTLDSQKIRGVGLSKIADGVLDKQPDVKNLENGRVMIKIKNKKRKITLPKDVWDARRLRVGDYIELGVKRVDAHDNNAKSYLSLPESSMPTTTIKLKDEGRRIYIPEDVWDAERLKVGDYVRLEVVRVDTHERPEKGV